jgi:hypothetical protein
MSADDVNAERPDEDSNQYRNESERPSQRCPSNTGSVDDAYLDVPATLKLVDKGPQTNRGSSHGRRQRPYDEDAQWPLLAVFSQLETPIS